MSILSLALLIGAFLGSTLGNLSDIQTGTETDGEQRRDSQYIDKAYSNVERNYNGYEVLSKRYGLPEYDNEKQTDQALPAILDQLRSLLKSTENAHVSDDTPTLEEKKLSTGVVTNVATDVDLSRLPKWKQTVCQHYNRQKLAKTPLFNARPTSLTAKRNRVRRGSWWEFWCSWCDVACKGR